MKKNIIIVGTGQHARMLVELIEEQNKYSIFGFISKKIGKRFGSSKKEPIRKYNMMTIDTGLMEFPPNLTLNSAFVHPQCIEVKILQPREPLTKVQTMATMLLFLILCGMPIHICINGTDEEREFMCGFIIGRMLVSDSDND